MPYAHAMHAAPQAAPQAHAPLPSLNVPVTAPFIVARYVCSTSLVCVWSDGSRSVQSLASACGF